MYAVEGTSVEEAVDCLVLSFTSAPPGCATITEVEPSLLTFRVMDPT